MDQAALDFLQAGGDLTVLYGLGEKATTAFAQGGKTYLGGVAQDVGTGLRQGHEAGQALGIIWTPEQEPLVAALQGFQQARRVRALIQGSEEIFKSEVAAAQASFPGASARNIGTIAGRNAQKRILELAGRLGIEAQAEARLTLPAGIISIPEEGLASYRVADVFLPRQRIAIELTLESSQDLAVLSIHKQGQIADYYLARVKPVIINAQ
jgi:hypothetical protein